MQLQKLAIHNFRNLSSVVFSPTSGFNLFYGENGAGKTSILEAIHVLSHGRSFRGSSSRELIQYENNSFVVRGVTVDRGRETSLAIERRHSTTIGKLDNEEVTAMSALSAHLPVQTVHPGSFDLLTGEPAHRRAFLDWGLYFADQFFRDQWKKYKRALSQRNAALKKHLSKA
ncbi:MAG TPA: DNA replication and repair protein RecF, partial [Gammaproteobacteria bacterium]|nr:DNA replication and repair protein RecF [Gammaproteobacteria bacterium]